MKMVNFTFNMLKKEKKNSIGYTISLSFVIAIIYVFFNVFVNPFAFTHFLSLLFFVLVLNVFLRV